MRVPALLVALLLAGCVSPADLAGGPGNDRVVEMDVLSAERVAGRCFDGAQSFGDVCDRIEVTIDNSQYTNDLDVGSLQWKARDAEGRTVKFADTDAHEQIKGGARSTIMVSFTRDDGQDALVELVYDGFQGHGTADIPGYA